MQDQEQHDQEIDEEIEDFINRYVLNQDDETDPGEDLPERVPDVFQEMLVHLRNNLMIFLEIDIERENLIQYAKEHMEELTEALQTNTSIKGVNFTTSLLCHLHPHLQNAFLQSLLVKELESLTITSEEYFPLAILAENMHIACAKKSSPTTAVLSHPRLTLLENFLVKSRQDIDRFSVALTMWLSQYTTISWCHICLRVDTQGALQSLQDDGKGILDPLLDLFGEIGCITTTLSLSALMTERRQTTIHLVSADAVHRCMQGFVPTSESSVNTSLLLSGLGLDDSLMKIVANEFGGPEIRLMHNSGVTYRSVEHWITAIDKGRSENLTSVSTGVIEWDGAIKLHLKLHEFGRRQALRDGLNDPERDPDRTVWLNWMTKLCTAQRLVQKFYLQDYCRDNDAVQVSSIYMTLRENPGRMVETWNME
jgi:hypothetical protein